MLELIFWPIDYLFQIKNHYVYFRLEWNKWVYFRLMLKKRVFKYNLDKGGKKTTPYHSHFWANSELASKTKILLEGVKNQGFRVIFKKNLQFILY